MAKEGPPPPPRRTSAAVAAFVAASLVAAPVEAAPSPKFAQACEQTKTKISAIKAERDAVEKACPFRPQYVPIRGRRDMQYERCRGEVQKYNIILVTKKTLARTQCGEEVASRL